MDAKRRPYVIIDPRAGHGPGIGGFKDDSQVGVALRDGHPVYFVIFFPEPEPEQTMLDVCDAERQFVHRVRELHPDAPKPAIVGNCQGGWAAMMLAAANPDDTGPIVINGAPMSYWGGAWSEGEGDNPMRYAGGLLGGTWLASLTSDLGGGKFDGAWLVQNFENLNPANTFWDKYYHVFANIDTEPPRFLDFERWWGGFYLMNREEIEWITQNLFVGNKLWSGTVKRRRRRLRSARDQGPDHPVRFDGRQHHPAPAGVQLGCRRLRQHRRDQGARPGDRGAAARGHRPPRHLRVRQGGQEGARSDRLGAGVGRGTAAGPVRHADRGRQGRRRQAVYEVSFVERRLEEIGAHLNRFKRADEKPFEAVSAVSEFNQRAYELFARPLVQSLSNEYSAKLSRELHPLRFQRWAISDLNPCLWWLGPAAEAVKAQRQAVSRRRSRRARPKG